MAPTRPTQVLKYSVGRRKLLLKVWRKAGRATKEPLELRLFLLTYTSYHLKAQYLGEGLLSSDQFVPCEPYLSALHRTQLQHEPAVLLGRVCGTILGHNSVRHTPIRLFFGCKTWQDALPNYHRPSACISVGEIASFLGG